MRDPKDIYIHTVSGRKYYPFAPTVEMVDIEVIAHHLATIGRWNGATQHKDHPERIYYSVAEHSVNVAIHVEFTQKRPDLALQALLHDAPEYVLGDWIRPIKYSPPLRKPLLEVEELNERVINARFGLPYPLAPEVKIADEAVCEAEAQQIVPRDPNEDWEVGRCHDNSRVANIRIEMLNPYEAKKLFLTYYYGLIERERVAAE